MLHRLDIGNYLLIEKTTIHFQEGFHVLIGESGAGKSLIVNVLCLPFAKSVGPEVIGRWGAEAIIHVEFDDDQGAHRLDIRIAKTKTSFVLDDEPILPKALKAYWRTILDVHSQNDFDLLRGDQLTVLDRFMTRDEGAVKAAYDEVFEAFHSLDEKMSELKKKILSPMERDYYGFQLKEIVAASLALGEDDDGLARLRLGRDHEKFQAKIDAVKEKMDDLSDAIAGAEMAWDSLKRMDENLGGEDYFKAMIQATSDATWDLAKRYDSAEIPDARELAVIESRLELIEDLKRKYKRLLPELIQYRDELSLQLGRQDEYEFDLHTLDVEKTEKQARVQAIATQLSAVRQNVASRLVLQLQQYMTGLKLPKAEFVPSFQTKARPDASGLDRFEFLVRVNVGSAFHAITRLSGGETSRIMLAIKAALMEASAIRTYCFDEIDVGVSGDVATRMAELMGKISQKRQVIAVTHLPMVAALADHLYSVEKSFTDSQTSSTVRLISSATDRENVLGRLLSDQPNEATTGFVRSLKEHA